MDLQNDSCENNITDIKLQALTTGLPGIACFLLNLVGLTAGLIFVCKRKNTFLLRLYLYMSFAQTIYVGLLSSRTLMYFWPESEVLCSIVQISIWYIITVNLSFIFSIGIILLYKLGSSCLLSQRKRVMVERPSQSNQKLLEFVFVFLNFGIPAVSALPAVVVMEEKADVCYLHIKPRFDCYLKKEFFIESFLIIELILILLNFFLYLLCICALLVWLCWLRNRHWLKSRKKIVIKEVGAWILVMVVYCTIAILVGLLGLLELAGHNSSTVNKYASTFGSNPFFQSCLPIAFFIYICVSVCPRHKKTVKQARCQVKRTRTSIQTAGLQTAPPSTRVSLPSDTAEHAPNFLSPIEEDTTEVSPLLA